MRKWMVVLIVLLLMIVVVYALVPGRIRIDQRQGLPVNTRAFAREILNEQKWKEWWPGKTDSGSFPASFRYNDNTFRFVEKKLSSLVVAVSNGIDSMRTELVFIPVMNDSIELTWTGVSPATINPVGRFQNASWGKKLNADVHVLLQKMRSFYSDEERVYGLPIQEELVADSNLISTSIQARSYPVTTEIYNMIDRLRNYIQKNGAKELAYPMLNISRTPDSTYLTRVAIPVDKKLKDAGSIQYRRMLQGGNILEAEVKGGPYQIQKGFEAMENYVNDHRRIAPAIHFQSLVTDRRQEPDSNQWITKLYWPVM